MTEPGNGKSTNQAIFGLLHGLFTGQHRQTSAVKYPKKVAKLMLFSIVLSEPIVCGDGSRMR